MDGMRQMVGVVVAVDSPAGQLVGALDDLAAHLPPTGRQWGCPLCPAESWPCSRFHSAAQRIIEVGLRLDAFVPPDLYQVLFRQTEPSRSQPVPRPEPWFDEEFRNG